MKAATHLALLATLGLGSEAGAFTVVLDAGQLGNVSGASNYVSINRCGVNAAITSGADALTNTAGAGWGIAGGGANDTEVDGGEAIRLSLPFDATGVTYNVSSATNVDGDGLAGETFVEAFGNAGVSLGVQAVNGVGTKNVSALFGGAEIGSIQITSAPDGVRIRRVSYALAPSESVYMYMAPPSLGVVSGAEVSQCGITFRAYPGDVYGSAGGFAVAGGAASDWVDGGEELEVDFGEPVAGARYELDDAVEVAGSTVGGHFVEAFDAAGDSLGIRSASGLSPIVLSDPGFFGDAPITRFVLYATGDQIRLGRVGLAPEPESAFVAALLALAALCRGRQRRSDSTRA